jgi:hypothetical protein
MELMKASFDGTFPDFSLPNPESGLSRIHVVTFPLFNSFNTASYVLRNSQCKFRVETSRSRNIETKKIAAPFEGGDLD